MTPLTPTEIEELRIAIAEEMGWKPCYKGCEGKTWRTPEDTGCRTDLPPYTTSLDAIQQAAMGRFKDDEDTSLFHVELIRSENNCDFQWQLTTLDWCIAFARTAKIWRYKV